MERERLTKLAEATAHRERQSHIADELTSLANRSDLAASDLLDMVGDDRFQRVVREVRSV
jgi:hypothetical protein